MPSVSRLRDIAEYCWDKGETTGDGRYCSLWRSLDTIADALEQSGALPSSTIQYIDEVLKRRLPSILQANTPEIGALLARAMREELLAF
jgi:hypothetical protein